MSINKNFTQRTLKCVRFFLVADLCKIILKPQISNCNPQLSWELIVVSLEKIVYRPYCGEFLQRTNVIEVIGMTSLMTANCLMALSLKVARQGARNVQTPRWQIRVRGARFVLFFYTFRKIDDLSTWSKHTNYTEVVEFYNEYLYLIFFSE